MLLFQLHKEFKMIFHRIFHIFTILAVISMISFVIAGDNEEEDASPRSSRASTVVLTEYIHSQPINTTGKINGSMKYLELSSDITSLYIDDEGSVKSNTSLLNAADQMHLANVLKNSVVNELTFRHCHQFGFEEVLKEVLTKKGIRVAWEEF